MEDIMTTGLGLLGGLAIFLYGMKKIGRAHV